MRQSMTNNEKGEGAEVIKGEQTGEWFSQRGDVTKGSKVGTILIHEQSASRHNKCECRHRKPWV